MLVQRKSISAKLLSLLVFLQAALIVTGGSVRLTGSGLGCPTWPECTPGSYTPIPNQAEGQLHAWTIRKSKIAENKQRIRSLAGLQVLGILGQGILGGITVLTDLHPLTVASHYMLSIFLIAGAISLRYELIGKKTQEVEGVIKFFIPVLVWLTLLVLIAGTVVTGSGPHAGDEKAERFGFDPRTVSWIHADLVIALIVATLILLIVARQMGSKEIGKRLAVFLIIILAQGLIGYIQYFTGLPEALVAAHLVGSTLVWGWVWSLAKIAQSGFKLQRFT